MTLENSKTIGEAVEYLSKHPVNLKWDDKLEAMYSELYIPQAIPAARQFQNKKSLGAIHKNYMQHYEFDENFFPFAIKIQRGISKTDYLACLLNHYHDVLHVLTAYEASDEDEMRLESFLLGQNPSAFANFFQNCFKNPEITSLKYKHLRDVWAAPVYWDDYKRGTGAQELVSFKTEEILDLPVTTLRKRMNISPRKVFSDPKNTCGIRNETPFFT